MISVDPATRIYHFALPQEWEAAQGAASYAPSAFADDGFIHLATQAQIAGVVERHLRGHGLRVQLTIDPLLCGNSLLWEWNDARGEVFPHLVTPIEHAWVLDARPFDPDRF